MWIRTGYRFGQSAVYGLISHGLGPYNQCKWTVNRVSKALNSEELLPNPALQLGTSGYISDRTRGWWEVLLQNFYCFSGRRKEQQILLFLLHQRWLQHGDFPWMKHSKRCLVTIPYIFLSLLLSYSSLCLVKGWFSLASFCLTGQLLNS